MFETLLLLGYLFSSAAQKLPNNQTGPQMGLRCEYLFYNYNYNEATVGLFFVYFEEILQQHLQPTKRPLLHRSLYTGLS